MVEPITNSKWPSKDFGIEARFAASDKAADLEAKIDENTKAIYLESIGNPEFNIPDFEAVGKLAQKYDIPLFVDNTIRGCRLPRQTA